MHLKRLLPWWARIGAKIVLSRLPVSYAAWKRLGLYEHGDMEQPQRAWATFIEHAATAGAIDESGGAPRMIADAAVVLEIGPGDSLYTAVIAGALGAQRTWLVDAGPFAVSDPKRYEEMASYLAQLGVRPPRVHQCATLADVLSTCRAEYLTEGVASLAHIPSESVDFCYSNAVLEHIPAADLAPMAAQLLRVMKPSGVCVHRVDLQDHLGGGLNNLRFSRDRWEGALFRNSGFYTNRVRFSEMVALFESAGFEVACPRVRHFGGMPIDRAKLASHFRHLPEAELLVSGFDMVLRQKAAVHA